MKPFIKSSPSSTEHKFTGEIFMEGEAKVVKPNLITPQLYFSTFGMELRNFVKV